MKNKLNKILLSWLPSLLFSMVFAISARAAPLESPDALVKRISLEVVDIAKTDKEIQEGNQKKVLELVESKVLPFVNFQRMTSLAAGRYWRDASPEQQKQLIAEFRTLLVFTYSGAISQVKDQKMNFKPLRADPADTEVEVRTEVVPSRGEAFQLNYRLEKQAAGWKIYDINVLGAWLVETYKGNFAAEISKSGVDGLVKALAERNKKLAEGGAKVAKPS